MSEQSTWNDQTNPVVRVIALHNVEARVSLISEAVDGWVRVELKSGSRENWRFYYLKESGHNISPFEDFWIEPAGGEDAQT